MAFTDEQRQALKAKLSYRHVKTRASNGATISYVEGWHAIAEANRIFGYDSWDRQTLSPRCLWTRRSAAQTVCFYSTKVRITVRAGDVDYVREGIGTGIGRSASPRAGARDRAQGGGDRRHQAGAGHLRQSVWPGALRQGQAQVTRSRRRASRTSAETATPSARTTPSR